jgi:hypothetical protein
MIVFVLLEEEDGANPSVFRDDLKESCEDWRVVTDPEVRVYVVKDGESFE